MLITCMATASYILQREHKEKIGLYIIGQIGLWRELLQHGNSPKNILAKYYMLTGKPLMPPKYALGLGHVGNFLTTLWQPGIASVRYRSFAVLDFDRSG